VLSGLQIVALREVALVPGSVRKSHLILTNDIATELFKLSAQPQFCLHLNCCALHISWNNGDLIKQTHRERRLRVLPIFSGRPAFVEPAELGTYICGPWTSLVKMRIWPGSAARFQIPSCSITTHYPGYFRSCWFDQAHSCCIKQFCMGRCL